MREKNKIIVSYSIFKYLFLIPEPLLWHVEHFLITAATWVTTWPLLGNDPQTTEKWCILCA
jgi:hypothetical protein